MSRQEFDKQLRRMLGLKFVPATLDSHYEVCGNLALDVLSEAVSVAVRECESFPAPSALLQFAYRVKDRVEPLPPTTTVDASRTVDHDERRVNASGRVLKFTREWRYYCEDCSDGGYVSYWCGETGPTRKPWQVPSFCGRDHEHAGHEWVGKCQCWNTNPTLLKSRERLARQAATRTARTGE